MASLQRKTLFLNILAAAWLALAVMCAGVFVIAEHDHVHIDVKGHRVPTSENCHICYEIQIALRLIEAFERLILGIAFIGLFAYVISLVKPAFISYTYNPAALKVKFNC
jgi:hypothetical protein